MSIATDPKTNKTRKQRRADLKEKSAAETDVVEQSVSTANDISHSDNNFRSMTGQRIAMTITTVGPFVGLIIGIVLAWQYGMMSPLYLGMMLGGWVMTGLGITIGYHRMLTHRSFETNPVVHAFWTTMGALAIEGSPLVWVAVHRKHHQHSDLEHDPHSPHNHGTGFVNWWRGAIHAHMGWLFGKAWSERTLNQYVPDLLTRPYAVFVDKFYLLYIVATLAIPALIGGLVTGTSTGAWLGLLWGGAARLFMTHHITWSINSICHLFGSRDFKAGDDSRNNLIFGILGHGEGWHNNHHAFPTSARHGLQWWQFDLSWIIIRSMELCGLAWNVKIPSAKAMEDKRNK